MAFKYNPLSGDFDIAGGAGSSSGTVITEDSILIGGASNAIDSMAALTNGQLVAGVTSGSPIALTPYMQQGNNCWFWNLSYTHSAGTLTLTGADGTPLSAANPAYIVMPSNSVAGRMAHFTLTADQTLTVSDMDGNLFGTTASTAWGDSLPMYIGFMADSSDANLEPIITRLPHLITSPASSANIGDPSAANADLVSSVFAWNDITEANYQDMQTAFIGTLTATKDASDQWTLDALTARDGVGRWNDSTPFTLPTGQNGAATGKYYRQAAGVAPVFDLNEVEYTLRRTGDVTFTGYTATANTAGTTTTNLELALPIIRDTEGEHPVNGAARFYDASASNTFPAIAYSRGGGQYVGFETTASAATAMRQEDIALNDQLYWTLIYQATETE